MKKEEGIASSVPQFLNSHVQLALIAVPFLANAANL